jgi:hypothetical protein
MEHLKDYVIGRMLVDHTLDPDALITTFVNAYYGPAAAIVQHAYIDTFHAAVVKAGYYMPEDFGWTAPFLTPTALLSSMAVRCADLKFGPCYCCRRTTMDSAKDPC